MVCHMPFVAIFVIVDNGRVPAIASELHWISLLQIITSTGFYPPLQVFLSLQEEVDIFPLPAAGPAGSLQLLLPAQTTKHANINSLVPGRPRHTASSIYTLTSSSPSRRTGRGVEERREREPSAVLCCTLIIVGEWSAGHWRGTRGLRDTAKKNVEKTLQIAAAAGIQRSEFVQGSEG